MSERAYRVNLNTRGCKAGDTIYLTPEEAAPSLASGFLRELPPSHPDQPEPEAPPVPEAPPASGALDRWSPVPELASDVRAWVGDDPLRAAAARRAEVLRSRPRRSLLAWLDNVLEERR